MASNDSPGQVYPTRHCEHSVAIPYLKSGPAYRELPRRSSSQKRSDGWVSQLIVAQIKKS